MKTIYILLILLIWVNAILGNDISDCIIALLTTLLLINNLKRGKNEYSK
ncbi:hypothetical protein HMPREF9956_1019 [Staphylococcus epidermidis 14.1.R1.SE]|nr:hypothetical protein HMPREF9956_1019 [Staphylococcus epidermidis 14.1.R1.SE]